MKTATNARLLRCATYKLVAVLCLMLPSCEAPSIANAKMHRTNFQNYLRPGMTAAEFQEVWQSKSPQPVSTDYIQYNGDSWDIRVYEVHRLSNGEFYVHHHEYVGFRNGKLAEWGLGTLPTPLRGSGRRSAPSVPVNVY